MKKKLVVTIMVAALAVSMAACGAGKSSASTKSTSEQASKNSSAGADMTSDEKKAKAEEYMNKDINDLIAVIGEPESEETSASCEVEGGEEKLYKWDGFTVFTLCQNKDNGDPYLITRVR